MSILTSHRKSPARRIFTLVFLSFSGFTIYFISQYYFSIINEVQTLTLERLYSVCPFSEIRRQNKIRGQI